MRHRGGFRLRGDDAAYGETVGPCVRVSRQSLRDRMKSLGCTGGVVFRTTKTPLFGPSRLHRLTGFAVEASLETTFHTVSPRIWVNRSSGVRASPSRRASPAAPFLYCAISMLTKSISPSNTSSNGLVILAPTSTSLELEIEPAEPVSV